MASPEFTSMVMGHINKALEGVGTLLYVCFVGSRLHGTASEESDYDVRFVYLPSIESCLLGEMQHNITIEVDEDDSIDLAGWSLHHFLKLLRNSDTNGIDVLFSSSYPASVLYYSPLIHDVFQNYKTFCPTSKYRFSNMLGYIVSQAEKYGTRGRRLEAMTAALSAAEECNLDAYENLPRLRDVAEIIVAGVSSASLCALAETSDGRQALQLCGKEHLCDIYFSEFKQRLRKDIKTFGERTKQIRDGKDWKALSHALRCIFEIQEILETGKLVFPLKDRELLKEIKQGKRPAAFVDTEIAVGLMDIERRLRDAESAPYNGVYASAFIMTTYKKVSWARKPGLFQA